MFNTIGLIGCGNMGSSVLKAITWKNNDVTYMLANRNEKKAFALSDELGMGIVSTNFEIAKSADTIVIAVKPQDMDELMEEISPVLNKRNDDFLIISMVMNYTPAAIQRLCKCNCPIIFIMPNTPVEVGNGIILYQTLNVSKSLEKEFLDNFARSGVVIPVESDIKEAAASLIGCCPAYVYMFIEALADSAVASGIPRDMAITLSAQMVKGSAEMVLKTNIHPEKLKDDVCSPGGSTIQGVRKLENMGFRSAVFESLQSAINAHDTKE